MHSSAKQVKSLEMIQFVANDNQSYAMLWLAEKSCGMVSHRHPPTPSSDCCWMILIATLQFPVYPK